MEVHPELINSEVDININDINDKHEFIYQEYNLIVGLINDNIVFYCKSENNEIYFQLNQNYDGIIINIPNFKIYSNISDIFKIIVQILDGNKYDLILDQNNNMKIIIKLMNMLGTEEKYELTLKRFELDDKSKIDILKNKVKIMENQIKDIIKEKEEMKNKINDLINENALIRREFNELKNKVDPVECSSFELKSGIINNMDKIGFILEEIEKKNSKIKNIKLIYSAIQNGDKITDFHSKCDNKTNTLMIIKTKDNYIFGGYTKVGWKDVRGADIADDNAFCFSFNLHKIYNIKERKYAMHCQSNDCRPSFGSSAYVFLLNNHFLTNRENVAQEMLDFTGETKKREINGGNPYFQVDKLEVFQISF